MRKIRKETQKEITKTKTKLKKRHRRSPSLWVFLYLSPRNFSLFSVGQSVRHSVFSYPSFSTYGLFSTLSSAGGASLSLSLLLSFPSS